MKEARSSPWPDLQPELLGLVLRRLPSLVDRVRLRAVCRPWRSNAQLQPLPPPLPWLNLLDGTTLSIPDGKVIGVPASDDAFCCGSIENWFFFVHTDGRCLLTNPFSKATVDLPKLGIERFNASSIYISRFHKLAVPLPMEMELSPGPLVVALILDNGSTACICQPQSATNWCIERNLGLGDLSDISFFNGKLYGVGFRDKLTIFEINDGLESKPKISWVKCITNSPGWPKLLSSGKWYEVQNYLVECCGRLLMVRRMIEYTKNHNPLEGARSVSFEVFEADLSAKPGLWKCVSKLGGQALFVGKLCSKSFPAGECTGVQEDCIYFMCDYGITLGVDPFVDCGVYNMRNGTITPLLLETTAVPWHHSGQLRPTWIFPADDM
ncbi:unnamed protein product [Urochloa decumbens]|uniref:KIB1-4 beta-propeller domain-containing protein n=1 Tax=Urochloa decumbens TaxID=240449 RepID=A0ABC9E4Z4_9POAL